MPLSSNEILKIRNLTKHYGRIKAVDNLNLTVEKGMVYGILGPNGSGKTTTLGMIMDVINKTSGSYTWFGKAPSKEFRKKIGTIFETPTFYPYMSGEKNLRIVSEIKEAPLENIPVVLKQVELYDRRHDNFRTYSLGMKQRLSIAAALVNDPVVLILDEPTNGLDPQGIADIRQLIRDIAGSGKTIILASHLLDEVQKVCSHFCVLKQGKLLYSGSVDDVSKQSIAIEVASDNPALEETLKSWEKVNIINHEMGHLVISTDNGTSSEEVNKYLFDKGIVVSHLLTQKKTLEKQFLEILNEN
ncbi:MAG: ABC transporter ATP-binding protein [Bacteroidetes bacterium]|nr:ABC transporter ATP-binding protein [Bacteroidota bacterium]MCH8234413.1 ABC transporter ATP-binding protein [Bacteroidota bacterium]